MRQKLNLDMEVEELMSIMAEGQPQAFHVLHEIITKNQTGPAIILDMDDMNIRGKQIVVGVEACLGSIKRFTNMIFHRSPWLVNEINKEVHNHKAVTEGASRAKESER